MSKYLGPQQILVYLDQCAVSRFLPRSANTEWQKVFELLCDGVSNGMVVCPSSLEHLVETAALPDAEAFQLGKIMSDLSRGWALKLEPELAAEQIIGRLRGLQSFRRAS